MNFEYSEKEINLFLSFGMDVSASIASSELVYQTLPELAYQALCTTVFCQGIQQGKNVDSLKRCVKSFLFDGQPRLTPEFDALIELD